MCVVLLLENVFRQLSTEAVLVSQNQVVSHIVEELIEFANVAQLAVLMDQFSADWATVCTHHTASHVTQALVRRCRHFICKHSHATLVVVVVVVIPQRMSSYAAEISYVGIPLGVLSLPMVFA